MSDNNTLVLPVEVKALVVDENSTIKPKAHQPDQFNLLPYTDSEGNYHPDGSKGPFISDNILSTHKESKENEFGNGVHLHWKLPSILTEGKTSGAHSEQNVAFPQVPNRWIVTRITSNGTNSPTYKSWHIEGDIISETPHQKEYIGTTIPYVKKTLLNESGLDGYYIDYKPTFRYQGKSSELGDDGEVVEQSSTSSVYLGALYATGSDHYQDLAFSGVYTKCRDVFGFYDKLDDLTDGVTSCSYHVVGWYANPSTSDPIKLGEIKTSNVQKHYPNFTASIDDSWSTICSGALLDVQTQGEAKKADELYVTIANNLSEAISSYISSKTEYTGQAELIENLLNAFQTGTLTTNTDQIQTTITEEALHTQSFEKNDSGIIYDIELKDGVTDTGGVSDQMGDDLDALNQAQIKLDQNQEQINTMRFRIFADWYKWSILEYSSFTLLPKNLVPPSHVLSQRIDDYLYFVTREGITQEKTKLDPEVISGLDYLTRKTTTLQSNLESLKTNFATNYPDYQLKEKKAPRYYAPNDPVLLFTKGDISSTHHGTKVKALARELSEVVSALNNNGQAVVTQNDLGLPTLPSNAPSALNQLLTEAVLLDSLQDQFLSTTAGHNITTEQIKTLQNNFIANESISGVLTFDGDSPGAYAYQTYQQPWNPVKMFWKANYIPFDKDTSSDTTLEYTSNFVTGQFDLDPNEVGYKSKSPSFPTAQAQKYANDCVLNVSVLNNLGTQLQSFINAHKSDTNKNYLQDIQQTLAALNGKLKSQSLSGFNQALLQRKRQLQMKVADPFASFDSNAQLNFSNTYIFNAVGNENHSAPRPKDQFNPIRGGYMELQEITLIDSHGQTLTYKSSLDDGDVTDDHTGKLHVSVPSKLAGSGSNDKYMYMPPAISQESRILMRWLSAKEDSATSSFLPESNSVPSTSPICGWVLPNFLDSTLNFYHADGTAIGMLTNNPEDFSTLQYISAPGTNTNNDLATDFSGANPLLSRMATKIQAYGNDYFDALLKSMNTVLPTVIPSTFRQDKAAGILMGRPLALTRASFQLELKGLPANDLGWDAFKAETERDSGNTFSGDQYIPRVDRGASKVNFPIRLGNLNKINDGLVGYFIPDETDDVNKIDYTTYYSYNYSFNSNAPTDDETNGNGQPQTKVVDLDSVGMVDQPIQLNMAGNVPATNSSYVSAAGNVQYQPGNTCYVAMLIDPQASIHATSGILPVKSIDIPAHFYAEALKKIRVSFLMAPVLKAKHSGMVMPIPEEKEGKWIWNSVSEGGWATPEKVSGKVPPKLTLDYDPQTIEEGWLTWSSLDDPANQ